MIEAARRLYRRLQWGRRSETVKTLHRPDGSPRDFAQLGEWVDLRVETAGGLKRIAPVGQRLIWPKGTEPGPGPVLCVAVSTNDLWILADDGVVNCPREAVGLPIRSIAYLTQKGDNRRGIYEHEFDAPYPVVGRGPDGHLRIDRGASTYTVKRAGIVG